jgi:outer membrane protein assembly factor BamD
MIWLRILTTLAFSLWLSGCGMLETEEDKSKHWSAQKLYSEASTALHEGDYAQAIKYYETLEARFPFGRYAMQSQLDVAYAHYKAEEPEAAIAAADRFIKLHPQDHHVDYAYYLKGLVNYNRKLGLLDRYIPTDPSQRDPGSARDSFQDFSELVRRFPASPYAQDARKRMLYLRDNLAQNEIHVARYYLHRGAYLAAVNRAKYVVENYSRTTAAHDALEIMIEAYGRLGLDKLQADARRVMELNEAKGVFVVNTPKPEEISWGDKVWDALGLDKN